MPRPGTTITRSDTRATRSPRTETGPWFIVGPTGTVDVDDDVAQSVTSMSEYARRFGSRAQHVTATSDLFDCVDNFFAEGGSEVFVSPVGGTGTVAEAVALFSQDLGPGQVSAPGNLTGADQIALSDHAVTHNRIAIWDLPDTNVEADLMTAAEPLGITTAQRRITGAFAPWVDIPPAAAGSGNRRVPPSGLVAGRISRNDALGESPNEPSAGILGESVYAVGVSQVFDDDGRRTLNENGVDIIKSVNGLVKVYGYRTLADPVTDENWITLSNSRLFMAIQAECDATGERFVFRQIDGQGKTISEFGGALTGVLLPYWQQGSLYGLSAGEAFRVDVSANVNTPETIANGEINAKLYLRTSPFAEEVIIDINKIKTTEAV